MSRIAALIRNRTVTLVLAGLLAAAAGGIGFLAQRPPAHPAGHAAALIPQGVI